MGIGMGKMILLGLGKSLSFRVLVLLLVGLVEGLRLFLGLSLLKEAWAFCKFVKALARVVSANFAFMADSVSFLTARASAWARSLLPGHAQSFLVIVLLGYGLAQASGKLRRVSPNDPIFLPSLVCQTDISPDQSPAMIQNHHGSTGFPWRFPQNARGFSGPCRLHPNTSPFCPVRGRDFAFLVIVSRKGSDPMSVPSAGLLAVDHFQIRTEASSEADNKAFESAAN